MLPHKKAQEEPMQTMMQQLIQIMGKLQTFVDRINNQQDSKEKGIFPAQPQPNPRGQPQGGVLS